MTTIHPSALFGSISYFPKSSSVKRGFDVAFSSFVLIFGFPIFFLLAVLVKCSSPGPIFYPSQRVGKGGKMFTCWKFRTMYKDADKKLASLIASKPHLKEEWLQYYKFKQDPRITKLGKWLRKTSLDELPQFWNVLKGELSVVGPRPVSLEEASRYLKNRGYKLFCVRPGLTGLWQTSGRNDLSYEKRIELEERYIDRSSFLFDLYLIIKTIPLMIFPKGAF